MTRMGPSPVCLQKIVGFASRNVKAPTPVFITSGTRERYEHVKCDRPPAEQRRGVGLPAPAILGPPRGGEFYRRRQRHGADCGRGRGGDERDAVPRAVAAWSGLDCCRPHLGLAGNRQTVAGAACFLSTPDFVDDAG